MVNYNQLRELVTTDDSVRDDCFDFHYNNGRWGAVTPYDARVQFEAELQNGMLSRVLIRSYVSQFNTDNPGFQMPGQNTSQQRTPVQRGVATAAAAFAGGLAAIIAGTVMDNEMLQLVGTGASLGGVAGGIYHAMRG